ncbi:hypothetical protein GLP24_00660 [Photobacterium carnosum]|nr:phage integrase N-terminal SAM-like domain-containing protein [Photobacterium carnosum]MCD9543398.1 hypothetical protein [Photobacterium carnosum]
MFKHFYGCPIFLTLYFSRLIKTHSWSIVRIDRNGLQFFFKHVLQRDWE